VFQGTKSPYPGTQNPFLGTKNQPLGTEVSFRGTKNPFHGTEKERTMPDFLPRREDEFLAFATTFTAATVANATALGIPAALVTSLQGKLTAYTTAYNAAEDPNAGKIRPGRPGREARGPHRGHPQGEERLHRP
jgi:hypothetical protein